MRIKFKRTQFDSRLEQSQLFLLQHPRGTDTEVDSLESERGVLANNEVCIATISSSCEMGCVVAGPGLVVFDQDLNVLRLLNLFSIDLDSKLGVEVSHRDVCVTSGSL